MSVPERLSGAEMRVLAELQFICRTAPGCWFFAHQLFPDGSQAAAAKRRILERLAAYGLVAQFSVLDGTLFCFLGVCERHCPACEHDDHHWLAVSYDPAAPGEFAQHQSLAIWRAARTRSGQPPSKFERSARPQLWRCRHCAVWKPREMDAHSKFSPRD